MKTYSVRKSIPESAEKELSKYPPLTRGLLFHRGIENAEEAELFLNPDYILHTHDPFLLPGMEKAVPRILSAIDKSEKICIYSDYDMDGIPGAIVLHDFFTKIGYKNFENYIPHRHDEGFGLNHEAMEKIAGGGVKLLITVDCGVADVSEVEGMQKRGVDVIITDHHELGDILPPAFAIVNPKCKTDGKNYPCDMLCGAGVAYKLVQGLLKSKNFGLKDGVEKWSLDMVGMATCADMVPLRGENRVFAYYGMKVLRKSPRVGLLKLFRKLKVNQAEITEDDIGFTIAPRVNAASRMGVPMEAFKLLATTNETEADTLSDYLNKINDERKGIVASMVKEMRKKISEREKNEVMLPVLVMGNPSWKPSLLGLAANTLMESHARPVFLWGRDGGNEGHLKGSCRSDGSVYLNALMKETKPGTFLEYGGHHLAGGFSVSAEKIHLLENELASAYEKIRQQGFTPEENFADARMSLDDLNWNTFREIERFAPFGVGNHKPIFLFDGIEIADVKLFGKEKNHLELGFQNSKNKRVSALSFFSSPEDFGVPLQQGNKINLVATVEKSTFRNFPELRLRIVDIN